MDLIEAEGSENRHPWELSRTEQLLTVINSICNRRSTVAEWRIADIGAGDLYFCKRLAQVMPNADITAVDTAFESTISLENISEKHIRKLTDISLLEDYQYDLIIMMDVLEHIEATSKYPATGQRLHKKSSLKPQPCKKPEYS